MFTLWLILGKIELIVSYLSMAVFCVPDLRVFDILKQYNDALLNFKIIISMPIYGNGLSLGQQDYVLESNKHKESFFCPK